MAHYGPIMLIDDNVEEKILLKSVIEDLGFPNELLFFENGRQALDYLEHEKDSPFIILCDMEMPEMSGMELCERIFADPALKKKAIPFIFRSGFMKDEAVERAYGLTVQGVFEKKTDYYETEKQIEMILNYWKKCILPPYKRISGP